MKIVFPPREIFISSETPIVEAKSFFNDCENYNVWIKRDDLTGIELSGNKIRKLEFLLHEAKKLNASRLITCGGAQSNHCRATAYVAAKSGMKCTLFLRSDVEPDFTANYFLSHLVGADIIRVTAEEYLDVDRRMKEYAVSIKERGEISYVIPEGGSNHIGAWGYVKAFEEIEKQIAAENLPINAIVCATGSGGTHAGLLFAKKLLNSQLDVFSVNVCDDAAFFKTKISNIASHFAAENSLTLSVTKDEVEIIDGYVGDGYGMINDAVVNTIREFALQEAIVLDPVYSAKAVFGLRDQMKKKTIDSKNILFIHTGGIFGLFAYAKEFKQLIIG